MYQYEHWIFYHRSSYISLGALKMRWRHFSINPTTRLLQTQQTKVQIPLLRRNTLSCWGADRWITTWLHLHPRRCIFLTVQRGGGSRSLEFGAMSCGLFDPLTMATGMALCVTDGDPSHRVRAWVRVCVREAGERPSLLKDSSSLSTVVLNYW